MNLGSDTGSLINHVMSGADVDPSKIKPGDGATILGWTDRHPATVTYVSAREIRVQSDNYRRTDTNGLSEDQSYEYSPNPNGSVHTFSRVKGGKSKGQWREGGRQDGRGIVFGRREKYYDPSF